MTTDGTDATRDMERGIIGEIWTSDAAYTTLRELCDDIGHRYAGSESERRGAAFLRERMRAYGLQNVRLEEFPVAGWERGSAALRLVTPVERDYSCVAMPYCPATDITAELLDVGDGELEDFERLSDQVAGKIVISAAEKDKDSRRSSHRNDKYGWAVERGAVGYIFVNQNPGLLHITGSLTGRVPGGIEAAEREAPIPGVGVSWEAGSAILRLTERGGGRVHLVLENRTFDSSSANIVGEIVGAERPEEVILLGGHYDGHDISQAAGDDGAGAVVGLEAGRALASYAGQLKRTIRVICFGAEEIGLQGAFHHARVTDPSAYRFVMNLDGAGQGPGGTEGLRLSGWPELLPYFEGWARAHHYRFEIDDLLHSHSDHYPFALRGVPNGTLFARDTNPALVGRGWGHTEADTFDKLHPRGLQMSAILAARLALWMSQIDDFPAARRSEEDVRGQLERADLLERAIAAGRFPPQPA